MTPMPPDQEIARVDSKGRITIPARMRDLLGMYEGAYASISLGEGDQSINVSLFAGPQSKLVELRLKIPDRPGALARAARALGELNIDLLLSRSRTIKKGDTAEWVVVVDMAQSRRTIEEVRRKLLEERNATAVEVREFQPEKTERSNEP